MPHPETDYRDFVRTKPPSSPPPMSPHWSEFAKKWARYRELTPQERLQLRSMLTAEHAVEDWTQWIGAAEWLLARRKVTTE